MESKSELKETGSIQASESESDRKGSAADRYTFCGRCGKKILEEEAVEYGCTNLCNECVFER